MKRTQSGHGVHGVEHFWLFSSSVAAVRKAYSSDVIACSSLCGGKAWSTWEVAGHAGEWTSSSIWLTVFVLLTARHGLAAIVLGSLATRTSCSHVVTSALSSKLHCDIASISLLLLFPPAPVRGRVLPSVSRIAVRCFLLPLPERLGCLCTPSSELLSLDVLHVLPPCPSALLPSAHALFPPGRVPLFAGGGVCSCSWLLALGPARRSGGLFLTRSASSANEQESISDRPPSSLQSKPLFSLVFLHAHSTSSTTPPTSFITRSPWHPTLVKAAHVVARRTTASPPRSSASSRAERPGRSPLPLDTPSPQRVSSPPCPSVPSCGSTTPKTVSTCMHACGLFRLRNPRLHVSSFSSSLSFRSLPTFSRFPESTLC